MGRLENDFEIKLAEKYFEKARDLAIKSKNHPEFCAILAKDNQFLTYSFGSSRGDCNFSPVETALFEATDKLSSVSIKDSTIYLTKLNKDNQITSMGQYFSEHDSRIALYKCVKEFVFLHDNGFYTYPTEEYYKLSLENEKGKKALK
jgi:hypothetical protein